MLNTSSGVVISIYNNIQLHEAALCHISYSKVVLYSRDHEGLGFPAKNYQQKTRLQYLHDALSVVIVHNQTQTCFQNDQKCFGEFPWKFKNFLFNQNFLLTDAFRQL